MKNFYLKLADWSCLECRCLFLAACAEERDNSGSDKLRSSICEMAADAECAINCALKNPKISFALPLFLVFSSMYTPEPLFGRVVKCYRLADILYENIERLG